MSLKQPVDDDIFVINLRQESQNLQFTYLRVVVRTMVFLTGNVLVQSVKVVIILSLHFLLLLTLVIYDLNSV